MTLKEKELLEKYFGNVEWREAMCLASPSSLLLLKLDEPAVRFHN